MSKNDKIFFYNLIGAGKNGKTLLGSLLDSHPCISSFPMEMKFVEHILNKSKSIKYKNFEHFLMNESKLKFLNSKIDKKQKNENQYIKDLKRLTIGNLEEIKFDKKRFLKIIKKNLNSKIKNSKNIREILIFFHKCLEKYLNKKFKKNIVIQDGLYGLRNIQKQISHFKYIRFIVMVRNPLDVLVISKRNNENLKFFRRFTGEFTPVESLSIKAKSDNYNYNQVNILYMQYRNNQNFLFVKYEDLIKKPNVKMREIANFLNVKFAKSLTKTTVFGQPFNCSLKKNFEKKNFYTQEINQFKKKLNKIEIEFVKIKFQNFLENFNYVKLKKNYSTIFKFTNLIQIYFLNICELKKNLPKKNFLLKFLYYLIVLNNVFLIRNLLRIIKT